MLKHNTSLTTLLASVLLMLGSGCAVDAGEDADLEGTDTSEDAVIVKRCPKSYDLTFKNITIYGRFDGSGLDWSEITRVNGVRNELRDLSQLSTGKMRLVSTTGSVCRYENPGKSVAKLMTQGGGDSLILDIAVPGTEESVRVYALAKKEATTYRVESGSQGQLYASAMYGGRENPEVLRRIGHVSVK